MACKSASLLPKWSLWARLIAIAVLPLALPPEQSTAIPIDVTGLPVTAVEVTSDYRLQATRTVRDRSWRCREVPPPRCRWSKRRDCCSVGGASQGAGSSGDWAGNFAITGSQGGASGGGGGAGGGGGGDPGGSAQPIVPFTGQDDDLPPVSSVPGPTVGVGIPGFLLLGCALLAWYRRRASHA